MHRLTATIYILPITAILLMIASTFVISSHTLTFSPTAATANQSITISSPTYGATETGTFQLVATLAGSAPSSYDMFWYVDNGTWNWMGTTVDNIAKQASIDVSGWHWHTNNEYTITLVAVLHSTGQRSYSGVLIHVSSSVTTPPQTSATATTAATPAPPSSNVNLYVNPTSNAAQTAASTSDTTMKRVMTKLAATPTAIWLGDWTANVQSYVSGIVGQASAAHQVPVFVAYNIPNRDCSGYSAGGASSPDAYKTWIQSVAAGIGAQQSIVVLEPDALAQISCLSSGDLATRNQLLSFAITALKSNPGTKVYLDAGNPTWVPAATMAPRLQAANIASADGFSLNVSNFVATSGNVAYGTALSQLIGNKHFVIDTSRNGNGSNGEWCNPSGRALGTPSTSSTGNALVDYFLWIKTPGESDGTCNGGPAAGVWWPTYAENLAINAGW